jgi:hypothetical protein
MSAGPVAAVSRKSCIAALRARAWYGDGDVGACPRRTMRAGSTRCMHGEWVQCGLCVTKPPSCRAAYMCADFCGGAGRRSCPWPSRCAGCERGPSNPRVLPRPGVTPSHATCLAPCHVDGRGYCTCLGGATHTCTALPRSAKLRRKKTLGEQRHGYKRTRFVDLSGSPHAGHVCL